MTNSTRQNLSELPGLPPEIVYLIRTIMFPDGSETSRNALFPLNCLDGAQMMLLFSGEAVPWSWSIWNDPRLADNELMVQLVRIFRIPFSTQEVKWPTDSYVDVSYGHTEHAHVVDAVS